MRQKEIAQLTCDCERHIGTQSGGMDQVLLLVSQFICCNDCGTFCQLALVFLGALFSFSRLEQDFLFHYIWQVDFVVILVEHRLFIHKLLLLKN